MLKKKLNDRGGVGEGEGGRMEIGNWRKSRTYDSLVRMAVLVIPPKCLVNQLFLVIFYILFVILAIT